MQSDYKKIAKTAGAVLREQLATKINEPLPEEFGKMLSESGCEACGAPTRRPADFPAS